MIRRIKIAIFAAAKKLGLFYCAMRFTSKYPRIICYHGGCFGDEYKYNGLLFMKGATFSKRIEWLQRNKFRFSYLDEAILLAGKDSGNSPLVVLTFDDGWYSTGVELIPILTKNNIPSTLYLSTKQFENGGLVIPVVLGYLLWKTKKKNVRIFGVRAGLDGEYNIEISSERSRLISNVIEFSEELDLPPNQLVEVLLTIARCLGLSSDELALNDRRFGYLTKEELQELAKNGCAIESHGHVHRYPRGEPNRFEEDLKRCAESIKNIGLPIPKHYCYPSGGYDSSAASILKNAGLFSATTCNPGLLYSQESSNIFYLPRFLDGENIHMLEFEAEMSGFSEILRRFFREKKR